ncbi:MAG: hypothetical protein MHPSP_004070, partial [Paramarteilia canceri]
SQDSNSNTNKNQCSSENLIEADDGSDDLNDWIVDEEGNPLNPEDLSDSAPESDEFDEEYQSDPIIKKLSQSALKSKAKNKAKIGQQVKENQPKLKKNNHEIKQFNTGAYGNRSHSK